MAKEAVEHPPHYGGEGGPYETIKVNEPYENAAENSRDASEQNLTNSLSR